HNQPSERTLYLACPLYKFDRRKYQNCFRFQLKRIKDVKQHLAQKHLQPPFCENCGLQFGTDEERFIHSTLPQCPKRQYSIPSGITPMQRERLRTRATRNQSLSSQWFMLWDVLFPGRPRPGSAYMEDPMREAVMCLKSSGTERGLRSSHKFLGIFQGSLPRHCLLKTGSM
ncbi:het and ankyrin domain protein, partial [Colletotrichum asianum]